MTEKVMPLLNYHLRRHPFAQLPAVDIPIPQNIVVPCPKYQPQKNIFAAKHCPNCDYYCGVGVMMHADTPEEQRAIEAKHPWSDRFAIRCQTIMEWRCQEVELP